MIGHLGPRVSALLDGQLSSRETEEAWAHVYVCHACRDLVEREGWVKTRLAGLCGADGPAPTDLKGALLSMPPGESLLAGHPHHGHRRATGAAVIGGSAIGAAMLGVVALGFGAGSAPPVDRRPPVTQIDSAIPTGTGNPAGPGSPERVSLRRMLP